MLGSNHGIYLFKFKNRLTCTSLKTLTACVMKGSGRTMFKEIRAFSTFTDGIQALGAWLKELEVTHLAIERTGVYWNPVFNILATEEHLDQDTSRMFQDAKQTSRTANGFVNF